MKDYRPTEMQKCYSGLLVESAEISQHVCISVGL